MLFTDDHFTIMHQASVIFMCILEFSYLTSLLFIIDDGTVCHCWLYILLLVACDNEFFMRGCEWFVCEAS